MEKQEVLSIIGDVFEQYTTLPLMFFTLGNYGKGYDVKLSIHPFFFNDFKNSVEKSLNIRFEKDEKIGDMHVLEFCNLCIAKAQSIKTK